MKNVLAAVALFGLVSLLGCDGGDGPKALIAAPTTPPAAVNPTASKINDDLTKLSYDVSKAGSDGFVDVDVASGDVSILLNISAVGDSNGLVVTEIRDPSNAVIYAATIDLEDGEPTSFSSDFANEPYANNGDLGVFFPPTPEVTLDEGTYRFTFVREDNTPLERVDAFVKSVPAGESADMQTYGADMNIWIAHPNSEFTGEAFKQSLQTTYKDSINSILGAHSLSIDEITLYDASASEVAEFATLDIEDGLGAACNAMLAATGGELAINIAYVRELTSPEGNPAGVAPGIGVIFDDNAVNGCVFVSQQAYVADPANGFTQELADQMMAGNMLHEAGHFMSLEHPTEEEGDVFDFLADTPQCDAATYDGRDDPIFGVPGEVDGQVTDFECGIDGGATNFIFYSGVPEFLPFEMSVDQAKVLRRHPLFVRTP